MPSFRPGARWDRPAAYIDPAEAALRGVPPGFYALNPDGKTLYRSFWRRRPVRLIAVDDAPGDPEDGAWHLEVAKKGDPISRAGRIVELEARTAGRGGVSA